MFPGFGFVFLTVSVANNTMHNISGRRLSKLDPDRKRSA